MGSIRRLDSNVDIQAFPDAHFVINDEIPAAQCSEAKIETDAGSSNNIIENIISKEALFTGYDLTGKVCTITASVGGNIGDFDIISNTNDLLTVTQDPGNADPVEFYVHDGGSLILTRDEASFAAYIHAAGYAYTFKGGRLFTNMPNGQIKEACTILWDPQT